MFYCEVNIVKYLLGDVKVIRWMFALFKCSLSWVVRILYPGFQKNEVKCWTKARRFASIEGGRLQHHPELFGQIFMEVPLNIFMKIREEGKRKRRLGYTP